MKNYFPAVPFRFLLLVLSLTSGLLFTACTKEDAPKDYTGVDDGIINKYLTDNHITTARKQASGLYYVPVLTDSTGVRAVAGDSVFVLYTGKLMDGTVFDASGNKPFGFLLGNGSVIPGWDEGIALMRKGEKAQLLIPSGLAYGASGAGSTIPPNTVIRFDVQLVNVKTDNDIITKYLADNHITTARKQASGLYYVPVHTDSTGVRAVAGKTVSVLYTGKLLNGTVFDASTQHGNVPISFVLGAGKVIAGWDEGIALMRKGEKGQLLIPSALAYGAYGAGSSIAPYTVILFDVELTNVQ